jgi:hypothetical protein
MTPRYSLPRGMRYSTLKEREEFYRIEFDVKKLEKWFKDWNGDSKAQFAVIIGRHTRIFPKKYKEEASTTLIIDEYKDFEDLKAQIIEFIS